MTNDLTENINEEFMQEHLQKFKELKLDEHYDFSEQHSCVVGNAQELEEFMAANRPLEFSISEDNLLYYKIEGDDAETVFDIDVSRSFSKSDSWLYDKIIKVSSVFPTLSSAAVSNEMSGFYICLVISSVFGEEFEVEFKEVAHGFDFKKWETTDDSDIGFSQLAEEWVQLGSKSVKLVAAAARFSLLREKGKKQVPSALQLPEEKVLALNKLLRDVDNIRYTYDNLQLSEAARSKMTKLDIKILIRERDEKIQELLTSDSELYQIWRLMHLNSQVIPPSILLKINRESKKSALSLFKKVKGVESSPSTRDERMQTKKVEDKLKKEVRRAYLNKLFAREAEKFLSSPSSYVAPDFV